MKASQAFRDRGMDHGVPSRGSGKTLAVHPEAEAVQRSG